MPRPPAAEKIYRDLAEIQISANMVASAMPFEKKIQSLCGKIKDRINILRRLDIDAAGYEIIELVNRDLSVMAGQDFIDLEQIENMGNVLDLDYWESVISGLEVTIERLDKVIKHAGN